MANLNLKAGDNITLVKDGDDLEISSHQDETSEIIVSPTEPNTGEEVWVQKGKNLLDVSGISSTTINGITFTNNGNGTFTLNGTADGHAELYLLGNNNINVEIPGNYVYGGVDSNVKVRVVNGSSSTSSEGSSTAIDKSTSTTGYVEILVIWGTTVNNVVISPMLTMEEDNTFEPYINKKIYTKNDNGVYEEFYKIPSSLSVGQGTIDSNYISNAELNHWEKIGNVVTYSFTLTTTGTWTPNTQFITNLPKPISSLRFHGVNDSANTPLRFEITSLGTIVNAWSNTTPSANQTIEGHITYLTND